jgi:hypothetical protein
MKVIKTTDRTIDLSGIDDHTVQNLAIVKLPEEWCEQAKVKSLSFYTRQLT